MGQLFVVASERSYARTQVPYIIDTLEAERIAAFPAWHFAAYPWPMWVCPKHGVYGASFSGQTEYCNTNYQWDLGQFSDPSYQRKGTWASPLLHLAGQSRGKICHNRCSRSIMIWEFGRPNNHKNQLPRLASNTVNNFDILGSHPNTGVYHYLCVSF